MKDYKVLEEVINTHIRAYEDGFNSVNEEWEVQFRLTITPHKITVGKVSKDVEYLRLEKAIRPKNSKDDDWESLLIYNQAYKFIEMKERLNPAKPWMYVLYQDLLGRLIAGGLEYSELVRRAKEVQKNTEKLSDLVVPEEKKIIVTDQMPEPMTEDDIKYQNYIKTKNKQ